VYCVYILYVEIHAISEAVFATLNLILLHCRGVCHQLSNRIGSGVNAAVAARLLVLGEMGCRGGRMSSSGKWYGRVTPAPAVSNGSASTLSQGALIDCGLR